MESLGKKLKNEAINKKIQHLLDNFVGIHRNFKGGVESIFFVIK